VEYSEFLRLFSEGKELGGTLFWEFGKKISSILSSCNPATTVLLSVHGSNLFRMMLDTSDALILPNEE
jgi:hypothetical protein